MTEYQNAKITSTMLGVEDHGILTCFLYLDYGGTCQGFGGYGMDAYDGKRRVGVAYGMEFIAEVLRTVGVGKWEDLPGKHVRAVANHSKVERIGHIIKDVWFDPELLARKMLPHLHKEQEKS
jgi:hypothetical protein